MFEPGEVVEERVGLMDSEETTLWGYKILVPAGTEDVVQYVKDKLVEKGVDPSEGHIADKRTDPKTGHILTIWRLG